ncbi:hypothetical protein AOLI_G00128870 [Acnodon oligacanthus]
MKFENILDETDGFGRYQIAIVALLVFPRITLPGHFLLNNFIGAIPSHHCDISSLDNDSVFENLTQQQRLTVNIPQHEDGTFDSCQMFSEPQFHLLGNSSNARELPVVQCQNGWQYDHSTFKSTLATQFDLVCDTKGLNKASATIFFIGVMFGAIFFGILSDKYGRRKMLLVSFISSIIFSVASAFSTSFMMFATFRFLTGFSLAGISIISIVLSIEWVDIEHRTFIGVLGSMSWSVGNMLLSGFAYLVTDWRMLVITVTTPLLLATATWWWVPESARWLIVNGQTERAYSSLKICASFNGRGDFTSKVKPELFFFSRRYGVSSTYYGISLNITGFGLGIYLTCFIYGAIEIPAKFLIYISLKKIGRRPTQVSTLLLTGICIIINIVMPKDYGTFRTVVAVLGKGLSEASFTTVFLYTTELYPTVLRQNGIGFNSFLARLGASISPLIMLLEDWWLLLPQVIFGMLAIISGLVACLLQETNNTRLPETIEDIEHTRRSLCIISQERNEIPLKTAVPAEKAP